ncbi:MAG: ABC transporter ATP-binding protein [Firmicutes bacterium]|nr:ABC transporter ATP-binding protein [Bacillota bacterium]
MDTNIDNKEIIQENPEEKKQSNKINWKLLFFFIKGSGIYFAISIIASFITAMADMLNPQIIRATIDNAIGGKPSDFPVWVNNWVESLGGFEYIGKHLYIPAIMVAVLGLIRVIARFIVEVTNTNGSEILVKNMRDTIFEHIERLPFAWHMKNSTGDIIQRCTTDIDRTRTFVAEQLTSIFRIGMLMVMAIYFMASMNPKLTLIAMLPVPIILLYSIIFRREMEEGFEACDEKEGVVSDIVQENLTGVRVVRAFAAEARERNRFEKDNYEYSDMWVHMGKVLGRFFAIQDVLCGMQILLVTVVGAVFVVKYGMTSGEYVAFVAYNAILSFPIRRLGRMISELAKAGASFSRLEYIMASETEKDKEGAYDADMTGDIRFENVHFGYEEGKEIIKGVDIEIPSGTTLGILGGTGSGKSTLMLLLDKLYEIPEGSGRITIGGVDIRDIRTEHLRSNIAMVLQEPYLFSRSIAKNISMVHDELSMDDVEDAARVAHLTEAIEGFSEGYETFVGERGVTLSGGQKQRTAIARALVQKAPIMIFDDSLSAVDTETDAKIRAALEEKFGTATIIIISHRITTLAKADQVVVLEDGKISERGTPDELKTAGGTYQKIYEIQYGEEVDKDERR